MFAQIFQNRIIIIKIFKDEIKYKATKLNVFETLLNIINCISTKFNFSNFLFFNKENSTKINKNKENEIILPKILVNNILLFILTVSTLIEIKVYLNEKQICKFNFSKNEKIKNFINIISNKIPNKSILRISNNIEKYYS